MTLSVAVTDSLDEVGDEEFHLLDPEAGALAGLGRLRQHAHDPLWEPRYITARDDDGVLRAALPVYLGHGARWSDRIHAPADWGLEQAPVPEESALVGGRLEVRGSLHCADDPEVFAALADQCAGLEELRGRDLYFGYLDDRQRAVADAVFSKVEWLTTFDDFVYRQDVVSGDLMDLPYKVRQVITHGERKLVEYGVEAQMLPWRDYDGRGCELIAGQNIRKGTTDHPELVRYRMDQWDECASVTPLIVHARAGEEEGVVTLLRYRDEIELYEVGLPDADSPARRTLYACLTFHEPRRVAQAEGCTTMRAGLEAGRPKLLRGASAVPRHCGRRVRA